MDPIQNRVLEDMEQSPRVENLLPPFAPRLEVYWVPSLLLT